RPPRSTPLPYTTLFRSARRAVRRRLRVPSPYLLSVGVLQPRKNLPRLVRAYNRIAAGFPHRLVLVGKEGWASEELREAVAGAPRSEEHTSELQSLRHLV